MGRQSLTLQSEISRSTRTDIGNYSKTYTRLFVLENVETCI